MNQYEDFMAQAYAMEIEANERYTQFADQLETHNNLEVAKLFRKLADIEALHAKNILARMAWPSLPAMPPPFAGDGEGPETAPFESVHYLMQPYHALEIALRGELRAQQFFEQFAAAAGSPEVRAAAKEMAEEEREHAELIRAWMKKVPRPVVGWDEDPDPPRITD
jgi:rubrerythrin